MTEYVDITAPGLMQEAKRQLDAGQRLVQVHCARPGDFEIIYSFDGPAGFKHLRVLHKDEKEPIPSISDLFPAAFLYENEVSELFGLVIEGISIDYKGRLYASSKRAPFLMNGTCAVEVGPAPSAAKETNNG